MRGTVKWFNAQKGYGFLLDSETKKDVFIHYSQIKMKGFKSLHENDKVEYELGLGNGREPFMQAVNVKPILTMKMVKDSLKEENLYVKEVKADANTVSMNTLGIKDGYMVVNENDVIQVGEQGMTFLDLAAYAGFDTEGLST
jgi:Cold shock proteins